jgi:hypothetical protein
LSADGTKTLQGSILGFDPSVFVENITDPADPDTIAYPCIYPDENLGAFNFFEASSIRKVGNKSDLGSLPKKNKSSARFRQR